MFLATMCSLSADQSHWTFRPLLDPAVPGSRASDWARSPIDRFILAKLTETGLAPQAEADRHTLLRRTGADLIGLPPSTDEIRAFVNDPDSHAYERLVDRLLDDPQYGVRWARHWLDVARFGESDGILNVNGDKVRKDAWKYRDAVIRAFNDDLPFDEFVRMQVTGTTGEHGEAYIELKQFIHLGTNLQDNDDPNDRQFHRLDDMVATTGSAFLGLTFGCARCHDHPVDPMSTEEYYQFTAFFFDQFDELPKAGKKEVPLVIKEPRVLVKGSWRTPGEKVEPGFLKALMSKPADHWRSRNTAELDALADWLTDTRDGAGMQLARVMVNRIWHHHFGRGLVSTPNDFGALGEAPSHPELLDWLARRFVEGGWRIKPMHRLIMNSAVYRQTGSTDDDAASRDEENRWLWQWRPRRLEAEMIRDRLLSVAGALRTELYGPSLPIGDFKKSLPDTEDRWRRSIYLQVHRTARQATLSLFDPANNEKSTGARATGVSPDGALFSLNSPMVWNLAGRFAARVRSEAGTNPKEQIEQVYLLALSRPPTDEETTIGLELFEGRSDDALVDYCHIILALNEFIYIQ